VEFRRCEAETHMRLPYKNSTLRPLVGSVSGSYQQAASKAGAPYLLSAVDQQGREDDSSHVDSKAGQENERIIDVKDAVERIG
jgi:hypothetical protein